MVNLTASMSTYNEYTENANSSSIVIYNCDGVIYIM